MIVNVKCDSRASNGLPHLVKYVSIDDAIGREFQHKVFGIEARARDDGRRELIMLVICRRNEPPLHPAQRKFTSRYGGKHEAAIFRRNDDLDLLGVPGICQRDAHAPERMPVNLAHHGSRDPVLPGELVRWFGILRHNSTSADSKTAHRKSHAPRSRASRIPQHVYSALITLCSCTVVFCPALKCTTCPCDS